jgi:glutamate N-acetyltransferase/amino-acid N-acetyltransferase
VLNAGGANCFTGPEGFALTHATAEKAAGLLDNTGASEVLVCSTGLIGELLPAGAVLQGIERAVAGSLTRCGRGYCLVAGDFDHRFTSQDFGEDP